LYIFDGKCVFDKKKIFLKCLTLTMVGVLKRLTYIYKTRFEEAKICLWTTKVSEIRLQPLAQWNTIQSVLACCIKTLEKYV
jgi:hypothetical protein